MTESQSSSADMPHVARSGAQHTLVDTPLRRYFEAAVRYEASDLLMRAGQVPRIRIRSELQALRTDPIPQEFDQWVAESLSDRLWEQLLEDGSLDIGIGLDERHRFRVHIFRGRGRLSISARRINETILTFAELNLPPVLEKVAQNEQGLVLVGGVTGSGKSTTIASMIQYINERRACHIVTIEDPIEYLFLENKAIVDQREIGIDVPTFEMGLKALVREDSDVVLIGEMRDAKTFEAALQAAETGHLVFGTVHASSTSQMFGRIYDLFPAAEHAMIRGLLGSQLRAFICQKLLPTVLEDPARVPATEVLLASPPTRKYILDGREIDLDEVIKQHRTDGMHRMLDSLVQLVEKEYIHPKVAEAAAASADELNMRLRKIVS